MVISRLNRSATFLMQTCLYSHFLFSLNLRCKILLKPTPNASSKPSLQLSVIIQDSQRCTMILLHLNLKTFILCRQTSPVTVLLFCSNCVTVYIKQERYLAHTAIQNFIGCIKKCNFSFWFIQVLELPQNWQTECSLIKKLS